MTYVAPRVSVCIPTYNYGRYIGDAIESVLAQTFGDFELIVVDNCSTDDTREIVQRYAAQDPRVTYLCNEYNLGMVGNWNRCLEHAAGIYVKILCSDDILEPECLARSVAVMERFPRVVLVTGRRLLVTKALQPIRSRAYSRTFRVVAGGRASRRCLMFGNLIGEPSAALMRREMIHGAFDDRLKQLIDLDMWLRLLGVGDLASLPETVCRFRQHAEQGTSGNIRSQAFIAEELDFFAAYVPQVPGMTFVHRLIGKLTMTFRIYKLGAAGDSQGVRTVLCRRVGVGYFATIFLAKSIRDFLASAGKRQNSRKPVERK